MSRESAVETLTNIENSNASRWSRLLHKLFSISELIQLANLLRDSTAVSMDELLFYVPSRFKDLSIVANQLLSHLPLLLVKKPNCQYFVNMHQVELNNPKLDSIFQSTKSNDSVPIATAQKEKGNGRNGGRIPILQTFSDILMLLQNSLKPAVLKPRKKEGKAL